MGLNKDYGSQHPVVNQFTLSPLGLGIPDGNGNFISPLALNLISFSEWGKEIATFLTADGRAHSSGHFESTEVTSDMYVNDPVQKAFVMAWLVGSENGLPGHKIPATLSIMNVDGTVGETWYIEQIFIKAVSHNELRRDTQDPAMLTITFSVYNPSLIPA